MTDLATALDRARVPARVAYLFVLLAATLAELGFDPDPQAVMRRAIRSVSHELSPNIVLDGARNILLFAGWGLTWMATAPPGRSVRSLRNAVLSGMAASMAVEFAQLFSTQRVASIVDVGTNTGGAFLGAVALVVMVLLAARVPRTRDRSLPVTFVAIPYFVALLAEMLVPLFRQDSVPGAWGWPWARASVVMDAFSWASLLELPLGDALLVLPGGVMGAWAMAQLRRPPDGPPIRLASVGLAAAVLVEILHAPLGLPVIAGAAAVHGLSWVLGVFIGNALVRRRLLEALSRQALVLLYGGLVCVWLLRPYQPGLGDLGVLMDPRWWLPLELLRQRMDVFSMVDVATTFLLFIPIGSFLAVRPLAPSGPLRHLLPAVYLAASMEAMQFLLPSRTPDPTDFLIQVSGALVGWVVVRRAGFGLVVPVR